MHVGQALNTIPRERAEWILWLDMDMVLEDITFTFPLSTYAGKDLIMWGQPDWIMRGDNARGDLLLPSLACLQCASNNSAFCAFL